MQPVATPMKSRVQPPKVRIATPQEVQKASAKFIKENHKLLKSLAKK